MNEETLGGVVMSGNPVKTSFRRMSVAPMLDWTDRHCRTFHRKMTKHTVLYTEMITTGAILFGRGDYSLNWAL